MSWLVKKLVDNIKDNSRQIVELILIAVVAIIPYWYNLNEMFAEYLKKEILSPDNFWIYTAISKGRWVASVIFVSILLWRIRKHNKDYMMNGMHVYHDYWYGWYWISAKILGIEKCNLILVPIHMQYKLAIRGVFKEIPLNESEFPILESTCQIEKYNMEIKCKEVNLILEDTYCIDTKQLPREKQKYPTIKIRRNMGSNGRHFSQSYIECIIDTVRKLKNSSIVNIYATTNPMNTLHIA